MRDSRESDGEARKVRTGEGRCGGFRISRRACGANEGQKGAEKGLCNDLLLCWAPRRIVFILPQARVPFVTGCKLFVDDETERGGRCSVSLAKAAFGSDDGR